VRTSDFSIRGILGGEDARDVLAARPVTLEGARGTLHWFHGQDPNGLILTGRILGEMATGDADYRGAP